MEKRKGFSTVGFGADVKNKDELYNTDWMKDVEPHDLVKYGLIPELVGRLPVITSLQGLDKNALIKILVEPKNSLVKQYKKLFELDKVNLEFTNSALEAVAQKALDRHTGARGLRSIMENLLTDLMYNVPGDYTIEKVVINENVVNGETDPELIRDEKRSPFNITIKRESKSSVS